MCHAGGCHGLQDLEERETLVGGGGGGGVGVEGEA